MRMYALFTNNGAPVTGLTLAEIHFTVHAVKRSDNSVTTPVAAQDATVEAGGGYYMYNYAAADFELYDYVWWAQYTGVTAVDCAYVFGNTDAVAGVDDLSGFTTLGAAEVQSEVEDALAAHGGVGVAHAGEAAAVSSMGEAAAALTGYDGGKGVAKDDTVAKELTLTTLAGIFPLDPASESAVESAITAASSQGEAATFSAQGEAATALADWVSSYAAPLLRILGLVQENQIIDTTVFDTDGHMTSARLRTFTDATLTIVLATYTTTATYDVSGNMTNFQVVKV